MGALWANRDKNDDEYFSGQIEVDGNVIPIIVFSNGYKEEEKHPDLIIYLREEREGNSGASRGGKKGGYNKGGGYKTNGKSDGDRKPNSTPNRAGSGNKKAYNKGGASKKSAYSRKGKG